MVPLSIVLSELAARAPADPPQAVRDLGEAHFKAVSYPVASAIDRGQVYIDAEA
jgi:hypothetical protein